MPEESDPQASIRHDLRTPLNQILGYAELLQEEARDNGQERLAGDLEKIQIAGKRLLGMIESYFTAAPTAPTAPAARPGNFASEDVSGPITLPSAAESKELPWATNESLLVVDDNEANRDMLSRRLKARGFDVEVAAGGPEALAMIAAGRFDLVLLDVMMPGMSGLEVLEKIRESHAAADLPVIMATALNESENIVEALKAGANDYVTKPIDFPVVRARVQTQLGLRRAKQEAQRLADELEIRNRFIRKTFGRYLSKEIVASLLESPEGLNLGGEKRRVTILMSDLRGFTALAERLAPEEVVGLLNNYLGTMADIILSYGGTIDEFIGDAILALFGAPITRPDDAERALACAVAMQWGMEAVNERNGRIGLPPVEMGIAINTGEAIVGNIGSQKRAKYGVVGIPVNLTSRLESFTVGGQILVSQSALTAAGETAVPGTRIELTVKGSHDPVIAYELLGVGGSHNLHLPDKNEPLLPLEREVPLRFWLVDESKRVAPEAFEGTLFRLSSRAARVRSSEVPVPRTNLKVHISEPDGDPVPGDLYGKLIDTEPEEGVFTLHFTSMPPIVESYFKKLLG